MTEQLTIARRQESVCSNCERIASQLEKAHDDLVGAHETMKAQGKELARRGRELSDETTPLAIEVRRVLDRWQEHHPTANTAPDGSRAKVVRGAMKLGHTDPPLPCPVHDITGQRKKGVLRTAVCTVADELIEAIDGLLLMAFAGPRGRCAAPGPGDRRFDDIRYALTDRKTGAPSEATIEQFRGYTRWARMCSSERLYAAYQRTGLVHDEYARLLLVALARENTQKQLVAQAGWNVVDINTARKDAA